MKCYVSFIWNGKHSDLDRVFISKTQAYDYVYEQNMTSHFLYFIGECDLVSDDLFAVIEEGK